jgi:hypothetical protein
MTPEEQKAKDKRDLIRSYDANEIAKNKEMFARMTPEQYQYTTNALGNDAGIFSFLRVHMGNTQQVSLEDFKEMIATMESLVKENGFLSSLPAFKDLLNSNGIEIL